MFNIRVYGFYLNTQGKLLLSDEWIRGKVITKIPGGGLHYGEGTIDCLKREYEEELQSQIEIIRHIYTTDFFQISMFTDKQEQIISVYYQVDFLSNPPKTILESDTPTESAVLQKEDMVFRYASCLPSLVEQLTLPIDKKAFAVFLEMQQKCC